MPYKDPIQRKEYLKRYRETEKYKLYSKSPYRIQYLKNHRLLDSSKESKRNYIKTSSYKQSHKISMKKYENTSKYKECQKRWMNSYKRKLYIKKWNKTPKGVLNMIKKRLKRRAIKNNIIETFTVKEFMEKVRKCNGVCPYCDKLFNQNIRSDSVTMDHDYPISKANEDYLRTGIKRIYTINDVNPMCFSCNSSKQDKILK